MVSSVWAQSTIKGTVSSEGENLPGVSVLVEGSASGTVTDIDGNYSVEVPSENSTLIFTFIGMATERVEVGGRSVIDVTMTQDATELTEVVVTAMGIEREKASLGYAVQEVGGQALTKTGETNYLGALSGKVAGVQVVNPSAGSLGGTVNVRLRGANSIGGNQQPLYVVDGVPFSNDNFSNTFNGRDYGNLAQDINPEDIESISVLKGPAASALYGIRGKGGVIQITTKSGTKRKGVGVEYSGQVSFDKVSILPELQNEYAGGYTLEQPTYNGQNILDYYADESWGPKMEGQMTRHWDSWFEGTPEYGELRPLNPNPDNQKDFFNTGINQSHNIAISGGGEKANFRLSVGNTTMKGAVPFSEGKKNNVSLNVSANITEKFKVSANVGVTNNYYKGRPGFGYSGSFDSWTLISVGPAINMWTQRQLDYDRVKDYRMPDGSVKTWNINSPTDPTPNYWDNIYYMLENAYPEDSRNRVVGNISMQYELTEGLSLKASAKNDFYAQRINRRIPSEAKANDFFGEEMRRGIENNFELGVSYDKNFEDFSTSIYVATNLMKQSKIGVDVATTNGLTAANLFNIQASVGRPDVDNWEINREIRSIYGTANFGYKNLLFLDITARNDWSSTLPKANNSYLYPSAGLSFLFSEVAGIDAISFGKLRVSAAQAGNDVDPYVINQTYGIGGVYGGSPAFYVPNSVVDPNIKPSLSNAYEAGLEMRFFNDRVGFDATYYKQINEDDILKLNISGGSGFTQMTTNGGKMTTTGVELAVFATPVKTNSFSWDMSFNYAKSSTMVNELIGDMESYEISTRRGITLAAVKGQEWGQLIGTSYRMHEGQPVVYEGSNWYHSGDEAALYYDTEDDVALGNVLPDFTGGWSNTFTYKNIDLSLNFDFQKGGKFHSVTKMYGFGAGQSIETVGLNDQGNSVRNPINEGGGFNVSGVTVTEDADGNISSATPAEGYASGATHTWNLTGVRGAWIYDASYFKLREVRLGYSIPKSTLSKLPFSYVNFAFTIKNAWLIHSNVDGIDPSEITPDASGLTYHEGGGLPSFRTFGFNLRFGL